MKVLKSLNMMLAFSHAFDNSLVRILSNPRATRMVQLAKNSKSTAVPRVGDFWEARMDVWRPTINDVERISWGKPAKKKGTGSRGVPHRLNEEERLLFDQARRKGFLEIGGSGWRSQRREAPLLNTYRSLCDARGQACLVLHKGNTGMDELVLDISPLRNPETFDAVVDDCLNHCQGGEFLFRGAETDTEKKEDENEEVSDDIDENTQWETRPIYQLPPYCITWELQRSDAKALGKRMAELFDTKEEKRVPSKKPVGVKPGKSRRHGGYGIG